MKKIIIIAAGILTLLTYTACSTRNSHITEDHQMTLNKSAHFSNNKFVNPSGATSMTGSSFWGMLKAYATRPGVRFPEAPPAMQELNMTEFLANPAQELRAVRLGHSTVLMSVEGKLILTDPVFSDRVSPVPFMGPSRFNETMPITIDALPHLDAVVISHDHYDHLDKGSIKLLREKVDMFYVPLGVDSYLRDWGVPNAKITALDWWESHLADNGLTFTAAPTQHFSGRGIVGQNKTLWGSWAIAGAHQRVYFGGDSGHGPHFKEIGERLGPFDLTMIECGAYSEFWPAIHMMPEQTVQAHLDLGGRTLMPIHWGTFNLSIHDWREPMERVTAAANTQDVNVVLPITGATITPDSLPPLAYWWRQSPDQIPSALKTAQNAN